MSTAASLLTIVSIGMTFIGWLGRRVISLAKSLLTELRANTRAVKDVSDKLQAHLEQGHGQ